MTQALAIASIAIASGTQKGALVQLLAGALACVKLDGHERLAIEAENWSIRTADRGATLLFLGEESKSILVMLSGWSFSYQALADGRRQILDFALPGALIGFGAGRINWRGVEAITACAVASLPLAKFYALLPRCPGFAVQIAGRIAESETRAHAHLTHLGRRNARERVAALIVELTSRSQLRRTAGSGSGFDLPLTLAMIGDALGLSSEHVCRTLARMAGDGVLELKRHSLRVLNAQALADEAGVCDIPLPTDWRKAPAQPQFMAA